MPGTAARLRTLINIGLELASERDTERMLQTLCVAARELFGANYLTLGILNRDDRTVWRSLVCGACTTCEARGADWLPAGDRVPGILATVIAERRTLRGENPGGDPVRLDLPAGHPAIGAFLVAPLCSPTQAYGWLCLAMNDGTAFTEDDEQLLTALAGTVGRIYENGALVVIARKRSEDLEREVVERRQVELALRRARDRAQRYLDAADVILLALDLDGRITLINRKGCDLVEWTESDLLGRDWIETCVPARARDAVRGTLRRVPGGDLSIVENPILTKSGGERLIEWRNTVLRDDAGLAVGIFSSGADITERHRAVEALRTTEERMRFALEAAGVGIWDMDVSTGLLQWSEILEAQFGLPPGGFGGTFEAFIEHVHPLDRDALVETIARANRSGADFAMQHRALWADGTVRWLSGAGRFHLDANGEPLRGIGISLDVTERRMLSEQYQQAQKMEAVGQLAGGVAHDFNNLLMVILGYCELLLADLDSADARQPDIEEIQKAGERAAGLTRQLLAFSRKQIIEPTLLDLNVVVGEMRVMLQRLIGENIRVLLGLWPDLPLVKADRGQVEQIVMNLAVNARDAMARGGTLTIETANIALDEPYAKAHLGVTAGAYAALTVTDTGTGMTPEIQARLFEPFFTTKEPGRGTGLGLATVHGIVTQSGGSVSVHSEPGKGSSIRVYFPRAEGVEAAHAAPPPPAPSAGTGQTVLVVEDEDGLRLLTRRLLQAQGYVVLTAASAEEAMALVDANPSIDLILTDVVMPGGSGPELTKQAVERRPALRVIYMSGYTEETIVHHGVLNPGIAFLHKPFTSDTLGKKIREELER